MDKDFTTIPDVPVVPTSDRITPNQVASGVTRGIQQLGSDKVYSDGGNQQIVVEDSTIPRVLMGNQATFGEGFFVSKAGINAKTNTDPAQWIFNSSQNVFKIVSSGTASFADMNISNPGAGKFSQAGSSFSSINHNLGYIPAIIAYLYDGSYYYSLPYQSYGGSGAGTTALWYDFSCYVSSTQITFAISGLAYGTGLTLTGGTFIAKYYLLQETAN